jgi:hypothetical protein
LFLAALGQVLSIGELHGGVEIMLLIMLGTLRTNVLIKKTDVTLSLKS